MRLGGTGIWRPGNGLGIRLGRLGEDRVLSSRRWNYLSNDVQREERTYVLLEHGGLSGFVCCSWA